MASPPTALPTEVAHMGPNRFVVSTARHRHRPPRDARSPDPRSIIAERQSRQQKCADSRPVRGAKREARPPRSAVMLPTRHLVCPAATRDMLVLRRLPILRGMYTTDCANSGALELRGGLRNTRRT
ncbi:hypothetical protein IEO21_06878 [Rhodonia placenta]|uniref:Uncharacterized protein n=1 Tax=Rhodonia placenta TaxID=104341 RepID=A0A8H7U0V7_9APHY|nr:hypothetical protein IEO21_06878 [Postia placenta]